MVFDRPNCVTLLEFPVFFGVFTEEILNGKLHFLWSVLYIPWRLNTHIIVTNCRGFPILRSYVAFTLEIYVTYQIVTLNVIFNTEELLCKYIYVYLIRKSYYVKKRHIKFNYKSLQLQISDFKLLSSACFCKLC